MEETLGKRIMQHRKNMGLTQDQLAEKLGVTAQAVSKWENDQSCPDINMLPKLAELFGTTTDALLGRDPVYEGQVVSEAQAECREEAQDEGNSHWEFHWDAGRRGALTAAICVLLVGGLLFAARYLGWDVSFWGIAWPSFLLVYGLSGTMRHFGVTNVVLTLLGGYFLIDNLGIFDISLDKSLIFPGLIVIFGLSLLVDALRKPRRKRFHISKNGNISHKTKKHFQQEGERFECSLSFGEVNHVITLPRLKEGSASISFGEMILDLTQCEQIAEDCTLDLSVSFGEMLLKVPRKFRVECDTGTSFGDVSTHGHPDADAALITLTGNISFGELVIYYV